MKKNKKLGLTVMLIVIAVLVFGCGKSEKQTKAEAKVAIEGEAKTGTASAVSDVETIPIETELEGAHNGMFVVTIDGKKYRYKMSYKQVTDITIDKMIFSWENKGNTFEFYGVKESPDHMLLYCKQKNGTDYLIEYAPAEGLPDGALEEIINDGFVVMKNGHVIAGEDKWLEFVKKTESETPAVIKIAYYNTLFGSMAQNLYELTKMDYPNAYLQQLKYDGDNYILSPIKKENGEYYIQPDSEYAREETFKYMKHYTEDAPSATALYTSFDKYVLVNDDNVTWDDIWNGMISSAFGAGIKNAEVFNKYDYKDGVDPDALNLVDIDMQ